MVARPGRIHRLLGPNGAGKTTMLRIALGLVRLDAGTVRVLGSKMASMPKGIPEGLAGFVEAPAFYPYLTGRQNLRQLGRLEDHRGSSLDRAVDRSLEATHLTLDANVPVPAIRPACASGSGWRLRC